MNIFLLPNLFVKLSIKVVSKKLKFMNVRQELLRLIEQMSDEQLSVLLNMAIALKEKNNSDDIFGLKSLQIESQAYQEWLSTENDIYDEMFADAATTG